MLTKKMYDKLYRAAVKKAKSEAKGTSLPRSKMLVFEQWRLLAERNAYTYYRASPCRNKTELVKIAGMAYSWMPTMLDLYFQPDHNFRPLLRLIGKCKRQSIDWPSEMQIIVELSLMINHSIVGASKALHIIAPKFVPFTDSRVLRGWNLFFEDEIKAGDIRELPPNWSFNNESALFEKASAFTMYSDTLRQWCENMNNKRCIRDIEVLFYFIGGATKVDRLLMAAESMPPLSNIN